MFSRKNDAEEGAMKSPHDPAKAEEEIPGLKPGSPPGKTVPGADRPAQVRFRPELPSRVRDIPGLSRATTEALESDDTKRLIVGREINLSGEITACDKLVVEGRVEANLSESRIIEIAATGYFKGKVEVDEAIISGEFEGSLNVRGRLWVRATGKVSGEVRYGELEIERGGRVSGDVDQIESAEAEAE